MKFCMECAGELIVAADGKVAICAKCGKSYTFSYNDTATPPAKTDGYQEYQNKAVALMELGKKPDAIKAAEEYLAACPQDYRAYLLWAAVTLNLYTMDPVDAVVERIWEDAREKLEEGLKIATEEERKAMQAECGEYCKYAEDVVQIFYDLHAFEKLNPTPPTPPVDPEIQISRIRKETEARLAVAQQRLADANAEYDRIKNSTKVQEVFATPMPKGFFSRKIELKKRRALAQEIIREQGVELAKASNVQQQCQKEVEGILAALAACDRKLAAEKPQYLQQLAQYEKDLAEHQAAMEGYEEKKAFFDTNPVALAIKAKLAAIKAQMEEYEKEIKRLNKQSKDFVFKGGSTAEYYLQQAEYRAREQRLTSEKLKLSGKISDLRWLLLPHKPKAPLFPQPTATK